MHIAFLNELQSVDRSIKIHSRNQQAAATVILVRSFETSIATLWHALTDKKLLDTWFTPVNGSLELDGEYQLEGNAGGRITHCEPKRSFALTWEFAGNVSWVEIQVFKDTTSRAGLSLSHTSLIDDHWATYGPGATGVGWELGLMALNIYLNQPQEKFSEEELITSESGKNYIERVSDAWGEASISAGTDKTEAMDACRRTTSFYTGGS